MGFDYKVRVGAVADDIAKEVLNKYNAAKDKIEGDEIVYKISGDTADFDKIIAELSKSSPDITKRIKFEIDDEGFRKGFSNLESYVGKTARSITSSFKKSMTSEMSGFDIGSLIADKIGKGKTKTSLNVKELVKNLKSELNSSIADNASYQDIVKQAEAFEQLNNVIKEIKNTKIRGISDVKDIIDVKSFQSQYEEFYKNAGKYLSANGEKLKIGLQFDFEDARKKIADLFSSIGSGGGGIGINFDEEIKKADDAIANLEKRINNLKNADGLDAIKKKIDDLTKKMLSMDEYTLQDTSNMSSLVDAFKSKGGDLKKLSEETNDILDFANQMKKSLPKANIDIVDIDSITRATAELEALKKKREELIKQRDTKGSGNGSLSGNNLLDTSELDKVKSDLDDINKKYADAVDTLNELQNEYSKQNDHIAKLTDELSQYGEKYSKVLEELENKKAELSREQDTSQGYFEQLLASESKLKALEGKDITPDELAHEVQLVEVLSGNLNELQSAYSNIKSELEDIISKIQQVTDEKDKFQNEANLNAENAASYKTQLEEAVTKLEEAKSKLAQMQVESDNLTRSLGNVNNVLSECKDNASKYDFDLLEQANKQITQFKKTKDASHYDKAASYYGMYRENGGTDTINVGGNDVSDMLISRYKELNVQMSGNREQLVQMLNAKNNEILKTRDYVSSLETEINGLRKLQKEQEKISKASAKQNEKNNVSNSKNDTTAKKTSDEIHQKNRELLEERIAARKKQKEIEKTKSNIDEKEVDNPSVNPQLSGNEDANISKLDKAIQNVTNSVNAKTNAFREEENIVSSVSENEVYSLLALVEALHEVTENVDKKTGAFKEEENVVTSVLQNEVLSVIAFEQEIQELLSKLDTLDGQLKGLPDKMDIGTDNNFVGKMSGDIDSLKKQLNKSGFDKLSNLQETLKGYSDITLPNLKQSGILTLINKLGKNDISPLLKNLNDLYTAIDRFNGISIDLTGLKVSKSNASNLELMASALEKVSSKLSEFDDSAKSALSEINKLVQQSSSLKDLNNIIKNFDKAKKVTLSTDTTKSTYVADYYKAWDMAIEENKKRNEEIAALKEMEENARSDSDSAKRQEDIQDEVNSYTQLIPYIKEYYSLLQKKETGQLVDPSEISRLNELSAQFKAARDAMTNYAGGVDEVVTAQKKLRDALYDNSIKNTYETDITKAYDAAVKQEVSKTTGDWTKLSRNIKDYYSLLDKKYNGNLNGKELIKFNDLDAQFKKAREEMDNYKGGLKEVVDEIDKFKKASSDAANSINNSYINKFNDSIKTLRNDTSGRTNVNDYLAELNRIESKLTELKAMPVIDENISDKNAEKIKDLRKEITGMISDLKNNGSYKAAGADEIAALEKRITSWSSSNSAAMKDFGGQIDGLISKLHQAGLSSADLDNISQAFTRIQTEAQKTGKVGTSFVDRLKGKFKELGAYLLSFASFYDVINILKQAVEVVHDLDDALTEMRKVSDESLSSLKAYQQESFKTASSIGTTAADLQSSTADWMRLGESLNQAKESAKDTTVLKNVSEFTDIEDATESLVAMSQAYNELEKNQIIDKLNNVGKQNVPKHIAIYGDFISADNYIGRSPEMDNTEERM